MAELWPNLCYTMMHLESVLRQALKVQIPIQDNGVGCVGVNHMRLRKMGQQISNNERRKEIWSNRESWWLRTFTIYSVMRSWMSVSNLSQ